jgi:hypothetical protein
MSLPLGERGGWIRGGFDLAAGRFPRFVFGGHVGDVLPVFHFHDEQGQDLAAKLQYLAENDYCTVSADDIAGYVARRRALPKRSVALCFDDAWASVWFVAGPLLKQLRFRAIVYAIPGRTDDALECRRRDRASFDEGSPFMTWPELRALADEGTIDPQSHTLTHAMVSTSPAVTGFITPGYDRTPLLARPLVDGPATGKFLSASDLGAPLYGPRSRMSDGLRVKHAAGAHDACVRLVQAEGGRAFFDRRDWRTRLEEAVRTHSNGTVVETDTDRQRAVESELDESRSVLNERLGRSTVNHVCLPWGVSGRCTEAALKRLGFATAVANRLRGVHAIRPGDDPYWLKRLPNRYIFSLPGRARRLWMFMRR